MRRGDLVGEEGHSDFPDTQVAGGLECVRDPHATGIGITTHPVAQERLHWRGLVNGMVYSQRRVEGEVAIRICVSIKQW